MNEKRRIKILENHVHELKNLMGLLRPIRERMVKRKISEKDIYGLFNSSIYHLCITETRNKNINTKLQLIERNDIKIVLNKIKDEISFSVEHVLENFEEYKKEGNTVEQIAKRVTNEVFWRPWKRHNKRCWEKTCPECRFYDVVDISTIQIGDGEVL
jgi:hypothetical protein